MRLTTHLVSFVLFGIICAASARCAAVIDDFNDPVSWKGPVYQYDDTRTGGASIATGVLTITRAPMGKFHMVSMERTFPLDFKPNTWIHFRFKMPDRLLGADMYTHIHLDGTMILEMGINGEQLWRMFENCLMKDWDDELFFGSAVIRGEESGKRSDIRIGLSDSLKNRVRYTDWHVLSLKYDAKGADRRIRFFVDGCEIIYRDLDMASPGGVVDNRVLDGFKPASTGNKLRISMGIMTDGDLYGDKSVNDGAGVRWLHAFADNTPAVPSRTDPKAAIKKDSHMLWDYIIVVSEDCRARIMPQMRKLISEGRFPKSMGF